MLKPRKRLTKKQIKEDKLLTTISKVNDYLENEWKKLVFIAASALFIILISYFFVQRSQDAENEASSRLYAVEFQFIERQLFNDQTAIELERIVNEFSNTKAGGNAAYYLGVTYYNLGNYTLAEQWFNRYLDDYAEDNFLHSTALSGLAATFEQKQMYKEALEYYLKAAKDFPKEYSVAESLLGAARNYALLDQKDNAIRQCEEIIEKFPNTRQSLEAQKLLASF
ncbi:tol-pal system YbgF family protein [candidate division KSB1 bacterium]